MDEQKQDEGRAEKDEPLSSRDQVTLAHAATIAGHVNAIVHAVHQGADPAVIALHVEHARDAAVDLAQHEDERPKPAPAPSVAPKPVLKPLMPAVQAAPAKSWLRENIGAVVLVVLALALAVYVAVQPHVSGALR